MWLVFCRESNEGASFASGILTDLQMSVFVTYKEASETKEVEFDDFDSSMTVSEFISEFVSRFNLGGSEFYLHFNASTLPDEAILSDNSITGNGEKITLSVKHVPA